MQVLKAAVDGPCAPSSLWTWAPESLPAKGLRPSTSSPPRGQRWVRAFKSPHPTLSTGWVTEGVTNGGGAGDLGWSQGYPSSEREPILASPPCTLCPLAGGDERAPAPGRGWWGTGRGGGGEEWQSLVLDNIAEPALGPELLAAGLVVGDPVPQVFWQLRRLHLRQEGE